LEVAAARAQERAEQAETQSQRLVARLAEAPDRDRVVGRLAVVGAAEQRLEQARSGREKAMIGRRRAGEAVAAAADAERGAWTAFDRERDAVGPLGPPAADRTSLGAAWSALATWSAERKTSVARDQAALAADIAVVEAERAAVVVALDRLVADAGLEAGQRSHRDTALEARVRTEHALSVLREALAEHRRLAEAAAALLRDAQVATALKQELHANRFEKWVLDQVLRDLCTAATALLHRLSQRAYSLALDDRAGFVVVDHRSADETRPARTLSGGETFLVSLALALALAEQVAQAGPQLGAAHLESLFLDEGFGTLDLATLDVVAAAIEDLGAAGRMVGLVSHVPELAERVPVRFAVQRGPRSSTIERVDR
jgi:exonuclease SbcC